MRPPACRAHSRNLHQRACFVVVLLIAGLGRHGGASQPQEPATGPPVDEANSEPGSKAAAKSCILTNRRPPEGKKAKDGVPADFDWESYLYWRPDLKEHGINTSEAVQEDYLRIGRRKKLLYKRYCIVMLYDLEGGMSHPRPMPPFEVQRRSP